MAGEQLRFPQAYLAMGNGDLVMVTNFTATLTSGAKQAHTIRIKGAGIIPGNEESSVSFTSIVSEDGPEKNFWDDVKSGRIRQLRCKLPGGRTTLVLNGAFSQCDTEGPLDDSTKLNCTFIGRMEKPEV